jgi:hypothetical protein
MAGREAKRGDEIECRLIPAGGPTKPDHQKRLKHTE